MIWSLVSNLIRLPLALLAVVAVCSVMLGCRTTDPGCEREIGLLRAEIIDVEDRYAILKNKYENMAMQLSAATGKPVQLEIPSDYQSSTTIDGEYIGSPTIIDGEVIYTDPIYSDPIYVESNANPEPFVVAPGVVPAEQGTQPRDGESRQPNAADSNELPLRRSTPGSGASYRRPTVAITEVVIHPTRTRAVDVDRRLGDDGLNLVLEPRRADGRVVLEPGELTISVVDPKGDPGRQQIGNWSFLPEETELFFVNDELGHHGIVLRLPWDRQPPANPRLIVNVGYVTPDGRTLQTSTSVRVQPPGPNYSPSDPRVVTWAEGGGPLPKPTGETPIAQNDSEDLYREDLDQPKWRPVR